MKITNTTHEKALTASVLENKTRIDSEKKESPNIYRMLIQKKRMVDNK